MIITLVNFRKYWDSRIWKSSGEEVWDRVSMTRIMRCLRERVRRWIIYERTEHLKIRKNVLSWVFSGRVFRIEIGSHPETQRCHRRCGEWVSSTYLFIPRLWHIKTETTLDSDIKDETDVTNRILSMISYDLLTRKTTYLLRTTTLPDPVPRCLISLVYSQIVVSWPRFKYFL